MLYLTDWREYRPLWRNNHISFALSEAVRLADYVNNVLQCGTVASVSHKEQVGNSAFQVSATDNAHLIKSETRKSGRKTTPQKLEFRLLSRQGDWDGLGTSYCDWVTVTADTTQILWGEYRKTKAGNNWKNWIESIKPLTLSFKGVYVCLSCQ